VLLGGDFSGAGETSLERTCFGKPTERAPGVEKRQMPFPSDSFPAAREVPVPSEMPFSGEASVELAPPRGESLSEEVPTPVKRSPEDEGFPIYRRLESDQMPIKQTIGIDPALRTQGSPSASSPCFKGSFRE